MPRIRLFRLFVCLLLVLAAASVRAGVIEDFDGAIPELAAYPGETGDPDAWSLSTPGEGGSAIWPPASSGPSFCFYCFFPMCRSLGRRIFRQV